MNIDASAVIEKYKSMLADQQYLTVLLELQVQELQAENSRLRDAQIVEAVEED